MTVWARERERDRDVGGARCWVFAGVDGPVFVEGWVGMCWIPACAGMTGERGE